MTNSLQDLVRPGLGSLAAYKTPPEVHARAKLDSNELPYPLPPEIAEALGHELARVDLNRYPPASCSELRAAVAADLGVPGDRLVFGNGSDEIITLLLTVFSGTKPGQQRPAALFPSPSFVYYRVACACAGVDAIEVPLTDDFELDVPALVAAMDRHRPNVAFFARPNNPTGSLWSRAVIEQLARDYPDTLVIADEAYIDYGGDTFLPSVGTPVNLAVMRTLSKLGFAALRIGYLIAHPDIASVVERARPPYNIGTLNQRAAAWLLTNHGKALHQRCALVSAERERVQAAMRELPNLRVLPSHANLLCVRVGTPGDGRAHQLANDLRTRGVLVRDFDKPGPLSGHLRITIGTPEENDILLTELADLLVGGTE